MLSALTELAAQMRTCDTTDWPRVERHFTTWAAQPDLRTALRSYLHGLTGTAALAVTTRSRETTTHFAWCLLDQPSDAFSFWLHEYKPQQDWRIGYADSVHNHRYHFCTTILRGRYVHERFTADVDPAGLEIRSAQLLRSGVCEVGESGVMLSNQFHRIPKAEDGTLTFLVKSRAVQPWSLSYDPVTCISRRHVPIEQRLGLLASTI
jgi:hypothetical protein